MFDLTDTEGAVVSNETIAGKPSLLVFSSPHCAPCSEVYPAVAEIARTRPDLNVVLMSRGARVTNSALRDRFGLSCPVAGGREHVEGAFGVSVVPYAVLVSSDGMVLTGGPTSASHLAGLADRATHPLAGGVMNGEGR